MPRLLAALASVLALAGCSSTPTTGNEAACAEFAGFTHRVVNDLVFGDGAYLDVQGELTTAFDHAEGDVRDRIGAILLDLPDRTYDIVDDEHLPALNAAISEVDAACTASGHAESAPTTIP